MKKNFLFISLLLFQLSASAQVFAQSPEQQGLEIAKARKAQATGWHDSQSEMKMILHTPSGDFQRIIEVKSLEVADDGDKTLMVFNQPLDIQGTAFLSFSHIDKDNEQWIYLPALKRVKRINARTKSGAFMGSEFSYEDLSSFEVAKYHYRYLKDVDCGKSRCYLVESIPNDVNSSYSKLITQLEKDTYRVHQIDFFNHKDELFKTAVITDYKLINDRFWQPSHTVMTNHKTGNSTELFWYNIRLNTGLKDADFNQNRLKSAF